MVGFLRFKFPSPLHTPNHPTAPPGTPEHLDSPEHTDHPHHFDDPSHPGHLRHPSLLRLMPQYQHQHQHLPHLDIHPFHQVNTHAAAQKLTSALSVLINPFHVSLVLENKGSVARDHLALERTYLAYVRTSLALASAGVALVQLFTISSKGASVPFFGSQFARPFGAIMIVYGLIILSMGTFRYFRIQHTLPRGVFPTSLHGVAGSAFILGTFMTVLFGILVGAKT